MYYATSKIDFVLARVNAETVRPMIKDSLCATSELPDNAYFYLHADEKSGFALVENYGENGYDLISVFSSVHGRGDTILNTAQNLGAKTLDCFEGYLVDFYAVRGWIEYAREDNWVKDGPAVVFMSR